MDKEERVRAEERLDKKIDEHVESVTAAGEELNKARDNWSEISGYLSMDRRDFKKEEELNKKLSEKIDKYAQVRASENDYRMAYNEVIDTEKELRRIQDNWMKASGRSIDRRFVWTEIDSRIQEEKINMSEKKMRELNKKLNEKIDNYVQAKEENFSEVDTIYQEVENAEKELIQAEDNWSKLGGYSTMRRDIEKEINFKILENKMEEINKKLDREIDNYVQAKEENFSEVDTVFQELKNTEEELIRTQDDWSEISGYSTIRRDIIKEISLKSSVLEASTGLLRQRYVRLNANLQKLKKELSMISDKEEQVKYIDRILGNDEKYSRNIKGSRNESHNDQASQELINDTKGILKDRIFQLRIELKEIRQMINDKKLDMMVMEQSENRSKEKASLLSKKRRAIDTSKEYNTEQQMIKSEKIQYKNMVHYH